MLSGATDEASKPSVEAITQHLRELSADVTLTLKKITGSVKLFFEGRKAGFDWISFLVRTGQLNHVDGFTIESVGAINVAVVSRHRESDNRQQKFLRDAQLKNAEVDLYLNTGAKLSGRITAFDKYSLLLHSGGSELLIFKHAISTVVTTKRINAIERTSARRPGVPDTG